MDKREQTMKWGLTNAAIDKSRESSKFCLFCNVVSHFSIQASFSIDITPDWPCLPRDVSCAAAACHDSIGTRCTRLNRNRSDQINLRKIYICKDSNVKRGTKGYEKIHVSFLGRRSHPSIHGLFLLSLSRLGSSLSHAFSATTKQAHESVAGNGQRPCF